MYDADACKGVALAVSNAIADLGTRAALRFADYHGFRKSRPPESIVTGILQARRLPAPAFQIDVVSVETDLTHEVHYHEHACAYVIVLGTTSGFPDPQGGYVFLQNSWNVVSAGQEVFIPPGVPHGFTVNPGGHLYFLSVQSPPIVRDDGHDDYVRIRV